MLEKLDGTNYRMWSIWMAAYLGTEGLWDLTTGTKEVLKTPGKDDPDFKAQQQDYISQRRGVQKAIGALKLAIAAAIVINYAESYWDSPVRHTAPRRMRGPSYPTLEAQTSRKDKATPPSGPGVWTIGHQPSPGKLRPLTKNLRIGTYLVTRYSSRLSVLPVPVRRIYGRGPSGTLCKWKQLNRSTAHKVTDTQSQSTRKCH